MLPVCNWESHLLPSSALASMSPLSFVPQLPPHTILLLLLPHISLQHLLPSQGWGTGTRG